MNEPVSKLARCAIYTRKSSEHNLDLAFTSLDAQREACEAYIKSQAHEGWRAIPGRYDDGAFSGASLERPALQQLLADIRAGTIDIVLVYKVDRLTRSLSDFAKLIELFDAHDVSFVSVTQSSTPAPAWAGSRSMCSCPLPSRTELIGERVRDKIAASKRKGIWVGGRSRSAMPRWARRSWWSRSKPRRCAQSLRDIWSLAPCARWPRTSIAGASAASRGGYRTAAPLAGAASELAARASLKNRFYIGEVVYRGEVHRGEHEPILDPRCLRRCRASLPPRRWRGAAGCGARPRSWPAVFLMLPATA